MITSLAPLLKANRINQVFKGMFLGVYFGSQSCTSISPNPIESLPIVHARVQRLCEIATSHTGVF